MLIAIPSDNPGGLDAAISQHFGHCDVFTLVDLGGGALGEVRLLPNGGHEHGGCMAPVMLLKEQGVDALIARGMGHRPLSGFQSVGIEVYYKEQAETVREAAERFLAGECSAFGGEHTCGGGGGHCGSHEHEHEHEQVERQLVDGPAEKDRVVTIDYTLSLGTGQVIDSSEGRAPLAYLHGHGQIVPGFEAALEGHLAGDRFSVVVPPEQGYGLRNDDAVFEIPRHQVPAGAQVGMTLQAQTADGGRMALVVTALTDEIARLDANHPLAGQDLHFDVTVRKVEAATEHELAHGHAH